MSSSPQVSGDRIVEPSCHRSRGAEDAIRRLDEDGYVVLRGFLDGPLLSQAAAAVDRSMSDLSELGRFLSRPAAGHYQDLNRWIDNQSLQDLIHDERLVSLAADLLGTGTVHLLGDVLIARSPDSPFALPWHIDDLAWPGDSSKNCSMWIPVDAAEASSGTLWFVPGSHRWSTRLDSDSPGPHGGSDGRPLSERLDGLMGAAELEALQSLRGSRDDSSEWRGRMAMATTILSLQLYGAHALLPDGHVGFEGGAAIDRLIASDDLPAECVEVAAGDVVVFDDRVVHRSGPNTDLRAWRRATCLRFTGGDSHYDPWPSHVPFPLDPELGPGARFGGRLFPQVHPDPGGSVTGRSPVAGDTPQRVLDYMIGRSEDWIARLESRVAGRSDARRVEVV